MLTLYGQSSSTLCSGVTRRDLLRVGGLSVLGLSLADLLRLEAARAGEAVPASRARAKNVLLVYLGGGMTHHDTFDPKPDAPPEIRGKYGTLPTKVSGIRYTEQMPKMAECSDLYTLVR